MLLLPHSTKYFLPELKIPRRKHLEPTREQNINSPWKGMGVGGRDCKQSISTQNQGGLDNGTSALQMMTCEPGRVVETYDKVKSHVIEISL